MKLRNHNTLGLGLLALLLAVASTGCLFSPDKSKPTEDGEAQYLPQTSEANVLENLITSYVEKELLEYEKLFDHNVFEFVFDPLDVQEDQDLPPFWLWDEERESTKNMFESELVLEIRLEYIPGTAVAVDEGDDVPDLTWTKVEVTNVELEVETRDPLGGENIIYKVSGDRAIYFFKSYDDELVDGQPTVRIVEWRDQRTGLFARLGLEAAL